MCEVPTLAALSASARPAALGRVVQESLERRRDASSGEMERREVTMGTGSLQGVQTDMGLTGRVW